MDQAFIVDEKGLLKVKLRLATKCLCDSALIVRVSAVEAGFPGGDVASV